MKKKLYPILLSLFFGCLLSAKAQDSAYDRLPACPADYRNQQDSGQSPYFVYDGGPDYPVTDPDSLWVSYRFTPFPDDLKSSYRWDFGDHTPISSDRFAGHLYADSGSYLVTLTVIRKSGAGSCILRASRVIRTLNYHFANVDVSAVQDPVNPAIYTYTLNDSARWDSVTWVELGNGAPDSLYLLHFSGGQLRYVAPYPGCYGITLMTFNKDSFGYANFGACIDSIPGAPNDFFVPCFPNPAGSETNFSFFLGSAAAISVSVYNSMGNEVQSITVPGIAGANTITLSIGNLPAGFYFIRAQSGSAIRKSKFIKSAG